MIVYIAGPYMNTTKEGIRMNVRRALALGNAAAQLGFIPIVPHAHGYLGIYGDPHEEKGPETRETALRNGTYLARATKLADGMLWLLLRDDESISSGSQLELDAFGGYNTVHVVQGTWENFRSYLATFGLNLDEIYAQIPLEHP